MNMIVIYKIKDELFTTTRGSFESEQACEAKKILDSYVALDKKKIIEDINNGITYVCEVIYQENRIVVDYGNMRSLILLKQQHLLMS